MATYVIGDVQGCFVSLRRLLEVAGYTEKDHLWLAGDLVNRGPRSVEVLRWCRAREDRVQVVLGNHDLHLLGRHYGTRRAGKRDTMEDVLAAPDRPALIDWLRRQPLLHRDGGRLMVHAGLPPTWTVAEAEARARAIEAELAGPNPQDFLQSLEARDGLADHLAALTRMRTVDATTGAPVYGFAGPPDEAPPGQTPWFAYAARLVPAETVFFGHWAALGLYRAPGLWGLDSGCVWKQRLTAVRLDDEAVFQTPYADG